MFDIIVSTKFMLFKFRFGRGGGVGCSPAAPLPPAWVRQCYDTFRT